ncbi:MAG TPA: alanine-zipper protein [Gammaproteobacteria bacterium]|nr:alanine-zipper protein [Gammaproteobacteria bacterium]
MLRSILRPVATLAATAGLFYLAFAAAQPPAPQTQAGRQPTIEERVATLERGLASVTTRFELRAAAVAPTPPSGAALESRVSGVERALERMQLDLQRVERTADNAQRAADSATRDAADARRVAQDADRAAQNALLRAR